MQFVQCRLSNRLFQWNTRHPISVALDLNDAVAQGTAVVILEAGFLGSELEASQITCVPR